MIWFTEGQNIGGAPLKTRPSNFLPSYNITTKFWPPKSALIFQNTLQVYKGWVIIIWTGLNIKIGIAQKDMSYETVLWPKWLSYRVFKLDLHQNKCLLGHQKCTLSHKHKICTFMRCGILTYDPWIWLKITSLSSTASVLNDGRISLEIPSFCSEIFFSKTS